MTGRSVVVRSERAEDREAIRRVNTLAFGGSAEAVLVDLLREGGYSIVSLVAEQEGAVVGHVLFSRLTIVTAGGVIDAVALAPLSVLPEFQRRGIGTRLTEEGLDACRQLGERIAVVVGHRDYYPRFGFSAALARQLASPYRGDSCMAMELEAGALQGVSGTVRYAPPFDQL